MSNSPKIDLPDLTFDANQLGTGELERTVLGAFADRVAHPEREAKANLLEAITALAWMAVVFSACAIAPAVILAWRTLV